VGRKERNRPVKLRRESPDLETTAVEPSSVAIRPLVGRRNLLIASLILYVGWLATLAWLAFQQ